MGYTHYWGFKKNPKDIENGAEKFKVAVELFKQGIKRIPKKITYDDEEIALKLCNGVGEGKPIITDTEICFNGEAKKNYSCETCYFALDNPNYKFEFCKTGRMPYDVAVCLAILCFKKAFGEDFAYRSDGDIENGEEGWEMAKEIIETL